MVGLLTPPAPAPFPLVETLGTKLRRLARQAEISNALINPPFILPPAWAQSATITRGEVRLANGGWYLCVTAGTTAASGSGPSQVNGQVSSDGTAQWSYLGSPTISASDPSAPTITFPASAPANVPVQYNPVPFPGMFRLYGGYPTAASNYWIPTIFNRNAGTPAYAVGASIGVMTDSPYPAFKIGTGGGGSLSSWRIIVDCLDGKGPRYIMPGGFPTSNAFVQIDWSSTSGRRWRRYWIEWGTGYERFDGILVDGLSSVAPPAVADDVRMALITDSMGAGSSFGPFLPGGSITGRLGKLLGISDIWSFSTGGTGEINPGSGPFYTYGQRVPELLTRNPDIVAVFGSTNDNSYSTSAVQAAALATLQSIRAGSKAPIIRFGVWPINNAAVAPNEAAIQAAVAQFNDPLTFFVPASAALPMPWVTSSINNSSLGFINNSSLAIAGDGTHPCDISTDIVMSQQMARGVKNLVLPFLR